MNDTFYPYLRQSAPGQPIQLLLSDGIYQEINLRCLGRLIDEGTKIYVRETRDLKHE